MSSDPLKTTLPPDDEHPPLLGSWNRLYLFVIAGNLLWLILAYSCTQTYA